MDSFNNESLQEAITNDSQVIDEMMLNLERKRNRSLAEQAIVDDYYVKGEPVKGHYKTDDDRYIMVEKKIIAENLELKKMLAQRSAVCSSLQKQLIEKGKELDGINRASSKQEAVEKYGNEIIADYLKKHKTELIGQFRSELKVDEKDIIADYLKTHKAALKEKFREEIISEYLETHKSKVNWDKANQKRSENCAGRAAAYLADFYNGMGTLEIAEKHGAVRGTIQRLLKINDRSDIDRLMDAYSANSELFDGATEQEVRGFLEARWNKKTESLEKRLAAAQKLIAKNTSDVGSDDNSDEWGM